MDANKLKKFKSLVSEADAILVGAGAGLSAAAGLTYSGKRFTDNFPDFIERYHLTDMYSTAFYPFETPEEFWAYFSRHIKINRYDPGPLGLYKKLYSLVSGKPAFVITTNVDGQFALAGFPEENIFATQGDYALFQCSTPCHDTLYDNHDMVMAMVEKQENFRIPPELIPKCPVCGERLDPHLRKDGTFVENSDWHAAAARYSAFIGKWKENRLLIIELGVGFNTPAIIRWPFEKMAAAMPGATLVRINKDNPEPSSALPDDTLIFQDDINRIVSSLLNG
jgi:NAD-dependent SIR2 family protein deacetylase